MYILWKSLSKLGYHGNVNVTHDQCFLINSKKYLRLTGSHILRSGGLKDLVTIQSFVSPLAFYLETS